MKYLRLVLIFIVSALAILRAEDEEEKHAPPIEIPDFSNLDEYIYEPKSTVTLSFRHLSGAKTEFSGIGHLPAPEPTVDLTGTEHRFYHDGFVAIDGRISATADNSGNTIKDPNSTNPIAVSPDGKTNTWSYTDPRQVDSSHAPTGYISFHQYSTDIIDSSVRDARSSSTNGMDLAVARDMGKLFGTKITWSLIGGMSVNDILAKKSDFVAARHQTLTDVYSLYGQSPPPLTNGVYTAPSSTSQNVQDANGNSVTDSSGSSQTINIDNTVLISATPAGRDVQTTSDSTSVLNTWKVKGAYLTFRGGPQLWFPITSKLKIGTSFGIAILYVGTNYTVTEVSTPEIGSTIADTETSAVYRVLPGFFGDLTLQYDLTDKAGFFAGAIYQSGGSYNQTLNTNAPLQDAYNQNANSTAPAGSKMSYLSKIDLSNQNGFRAGMSIRF